MGLLSTPIQTISEENESVYPSYEQKTQYETEKLRCSNNFLIHNRYILHVNIMHKDMTPNALIEKK